MRGQLSAFYSGTRIPTGSGHVHTFGKMAWCLDGEIKDVNHPGPVFRVYGRPMLPNFGHIFESPRELEELLQPRDLG